MSYASLEDALLFGSGQERSFLCPYHPDHNASASINSVTGLWCCYACGAAGKAGSEALSFDANGVAQFTKLLFEEMSRDDYYPESWLNLFDASGPGDYWLSRFDESTCRHFRFGSAPQVATYPMRDNTGCVMGVVTRDLTGNRPAKYMYPKGVHVSEYLANFHAVNDDHLILVEGMADVAAVHEVGFQAVGSYRAGLSTAQATLLRKHQPKTLWVAYDQDKAGNDGYSQVLCKLGYAFNVKRLWWTDYKDIAEMPPPLRQEMLATTLARVTLVY